MMSLRNTTKNWLLYGAIISMITAVILLIILGEEMVQGSRNISDFPFITILFLSAILAPIYEEFVFRGIYSSKKLFKIVSCILLPVFVLLSDTGLLAPVLLAFFGITYVLFMKYEINYMEDLSMLLNVLLFTSVHYKIEEFIDPSMFYYAFFQFALGSLFIWLILNFGILKAIISHVIWNFTLMIIMVYGLHYPDEEINTFENSEIRVEWKRVPRFDDKNTLIKNIDDDTLIAKNVDARFFYKFLKNPHNLKLKEEGFRLLQTENFMKYDFEVIVKNDQVDSLRQETVDFLIEEKLIYFIEK